VAFARLAGAVGVTITGVAVVVRAEVAASPALFQAATL